MFRIQAPDAIPATVRVQPKGAAPGAPAIEIPVRFRHYGERELAALARVGTTDALLLAEMIVSWDGVADFDGEPVAPTERAIARLLDQLNADAPRAFLEAFKAARDAAARGN